MKKTIKQHGNHIKNEVNIALLPIKITPEISDKSRKKGIDTNGSDYATFLLL